MMPARGNCRIEDGDPTYMHGVVLVKLGNLLHLAHHDENRRRSTKEPILGSQVIFPGRREMRNTLLEELAVNLDVRHCD